MADQNARTREVLEGLDLREDWRHRLLALLRLPTVGAPSVAGERHFYLRRAGDQDQAVLMMGSAVDAGAPARVVLDPHAEAADHAASIDWFSPSPSGTLVAYGIADSGCERATMRVIDVDRDVVLPDAIPHVRHPSVSWLPDGSAFAYSRLPDPETVAAGEDGYWEALWWHRVGTDAASDEPVLSDNVDRTALPSTTISPDGRWLVVHVHLMPTRTDVMLLDRQTGTKTVVVEGQEASTSLQVVGDRLFGSTNLGAPRGRVVSAPVASPRAENWDTLVPESDAVVESVVVAGDFLLVASTEHAVSSLWRYDLDGSGGEEVVLPAMGSVGSLDADTAHERAFLTFSLFDKPAGILRWSPAGIEPWTRELDAVPSALGGC